ncbi:MAG: UDP-N-acetylglucosamine 2-epimerase [Legionella sp.]|nr:UDP-N-acetylglucosamine 2-epimerase [Legionella sp.]
MKKISVVSGTRADYGLIYWLMKELQHSKIFKLQIIVSCMHLSSKFGETWKQFEEDGFEINETVSFGELEDSKSSLISQLSLGIKGFFNSLERLNPDLLIILGDRYEMLPASQAAVFLGIPIAHIHGGEITEGAFDDIIRHSITKMSTYHFASTEVYRKRIIQMGESPENVINTGAIGLENIRRLNLLSKEKMSDIPFREQNFLITYHPVTASNEDALDNLLDILSSYSNACQIITMPNSDPGYKIIFEKLAYYAESKENVYLTTSLGSLRYLSCMKICDVVIGNSSSGIVEAPFLGTPTLNIGVRQKGRISDQSVIDCASDEIKEKLDYILNNTFENKSLYGEGYCVDKVMSFLERTQYKVKSGFYDV